MTNVPQKIRDAWADVYRLFDASYTMDGSDSAWEEYWNKANAMVQKYGDGIPLLEILEAVAHMLEKFVYGKEKNHSMTWDKDEPYPHPKEIK